MNSQLRKYRSAPAVSNLNDLKKIIQSLEYCSLPYSFLDTSNLKKLKKSNKISTKIYEDVQLWKKSNDLNEGSGYLSEIIHLLKLLEIIKIRKPTEDDLDNYLEPDGPQIKDIITEKVNVQELTDIGYHLCDIIKTENTKLFEVYLFWLFLKNKRLTRIWQFLLMKKEVFSSEDIRDAIKSIENDTFTISHFVTWSDYFNLCSLTSDSKIKLLDEKKISLKFLYSTILELNNCYIGNEGIHLEILVNKLTDTFHISTNRINFYNILESILIIDNKESVEGSFTGRGEKSFPSFPKINKLKIRKKIELFPRFNSVPDKYLTSFLDIGC